MEISVAPRLAILAAPLLLLLTGSGTAAAGNCPNNPQALGTSRTIVVDPREHARIGGMNYAETLPLADREVVLTFDDGPLPPYSNRILDILAAECVRATYFIVGRMANAFPDLVRRAQSEGHTIGTHSLSHPFPFRGQGLERSKVQIDGGIEATAAALGDAAAVAPFFRFPGLGRTDAVENYLASRGLMAWSADVPGDDWRRIKAQEIIRRTIMRLEAKGRGVVLLHDIQPATALALPGLLAELKTRGFRVVHVEPSTADRPKTATVREDWLLNVSKRARLPVLSLASLADLNEQFAARSDAPELCALSQPAPVKQAAARPLVAKHARARQAAAVGHRKPARREHVAHAPAPIGWPFFSRSHISHD